MCIRDRFNTMFALIVVAWPTYARMMRSVVLSVKENEYVAASEVLGASKIRILMKEVIPNSISSVLIMATKMCIRDRCHSVQADLQLHGCSGQRGCEGARRHGCRGCIVH